MSVYALRDPRTGLCRYVGKTAKKPAERLRQHLAAPHSKLLKAWIAELSSVGLRPELTLPGPGTEQEWIDALRPDLNTNPGSVLFDDGIIVDDEARTTVRFSQADKEAAERAAAAERRPLNFWIAEAVHQRLIRDGFKTEAPPEKKKARG